jgi:5'(3')-deoxyribonucleotidase
MEDALVRRLYLDCDGVLADFDRAFRDHFAGQDPHDYEARHGSKEFWTSIASVPNFYRNLPLMPGACALVEALADLRPIILTGCPMGGWAQVQKIDWAAEHFPDLPLVACVARQKSRFCRPGDVLVDDRDHYRGLWEDAGGVFVHFLGDVPAAIAEVRHQFDGIDPTC